MARDATPATDLLSELPAEARHLLLSQQKRVRLDAGDILFRHGTPASSVYIVNRGAIAIRPAGRERFIGRIGAGEVIGEMAVISGQPRSADAMALRDCELIEIGAELFSTLHRTYPGFAEAVARLLVERLRRASADLPQRPASTTTALFPAGPGLDMAAIAGRLADAAGGLGITTAIAGPDEAALRDGAVTRLEALHEHVFLWSQGSGTAADEACFRQADRVVAVARADAVAPSPFLVAAFAARAPHQRGDVALLHGDDARRPSDTAAALADLAPQRHFHLRETAPADWSRLARSLTGRSTGLVLSGGGARAYAHLGVLRALAELDIAIDVVSGVSMGAIIAASLARGWSLDQIEYNFRRAFVERNPLSDYSLPLIGLVRGGRVERMLRYYFGNTDIVDLWLPFRCYSANLTTGELVEHRSGPVHEALRASVSLPGILPPVVTEEGVLVDGAVMSNLPVEPMRRINDGPIIAVDVARNLALTPQWLRDEMAKGLVHRMRHPPLISLLMRSATLPGDALSQQQSRQADTVIVPPLGGIEIRDWRAFDEAVRIGYEHTLQALGGGPPPVLAD